MKKAKLFHRRTWRAAWRTLQRYLFGRDPSWSIQALRVLHRVRMNMIIRLPMTRSHSIFSVRVWTSRRAYDRLAHLLRSARHTIFIQIFIWEDDAIGQMIAQAVVAAADRGVRVHIAKDRTGDVFEMSSDFFGTRTSKEEPWSRFWHHPNITITHAAEDNHSKVFIIDEDRILIGTLNIGKPYIDWHDYLIELRGRSFVDHYLSDGNPGAVSTVNGVRLVLNSVTRKEIRPCLEGLITSARRLLILQQSYFSDPHCIDLLAAKTHEGVRVIILLPEKTGVYERTNTAAVQKLMQKSDRRFLQVLVYPEKKLHVKLLLVDRERLFIGSANMMPSSLDGMGETNLLIEGRNDVVLQRIRIRVALDIARAKLLREIPQLRWWDRLLVRIGF